MANIENWFMYVLVFKGNCIGYFVQHKIDCLKNTDNQNMFYHWIIKNSNIDDKFRRQARHCSQLSDNGPSGRATTNSIARLGPSPSDEPLCHDGGLGLQVTECVWCL